MRTTIEVGWRSEFTPELLESSHALRHHVFVRRLARNPPPEAGAGRDSYDTPHTMYLLVRDAQRRVTACARLLPTTGSYMLRELFPQLLGTMPAPHHPAVWELSRFAIDAHRSAAGRVSALSRATLYLLDSVLDVARHHAVERLVLVTSLAIERLLLRARYNVYRIAPPAHVEQAMCVALFIEVPPASASQSAH